MPHRIIKLQTGTGHPVPVIREQSAHLARLTVELSPAYIQACKKLTYACIHDTSAHTYNMKANTTFTLWPMLKMGNADVLLNVCKA